MAINAGDVVYTIGADLSEFTKSLKLAESNLKDISSTVSSKVKTMGAAFTVAGAAITTGFIAASTSGISFKTSLAEIASLGVKQLDTIEAGIKSVSATFASDLSVSAKATYDIISSTGLDGAEAIKVLELSAKAAAAGVASVSDSATLGVGVMNAYGKTVDDLGRIYDEAFIAVKDGVTTFGELSTTVGNLSPTFQAAGLSSGEMFAGIAAITKAGIKTDQAITSLQQAVVSVIKPTAEASTLADSLGLSFDSASLASKGLAGFLEDVKDKTGGNVDQMATLFGSVEALKGVLALTGSQSKAFSDILEKMNNPLGATNEAFELLVANDPSFAMRQIWTEVKILAVDLTDALLPAINAVTGNIYNVVSGFREWRTENEGLFEAITALTAAVGLSLVGIGALVVGVAPLITVIGTLAAGMVAGVTAVTGLGAGMISFALSIPSTIAALAPLAIAAGTVFAAFTVGAATVALVGNGIIKSLGELKTIGGTMLSGIKQAWLNSWGDIKSGMGLILDGILGIFINIKNQLIESSEEISAAWKELSASAQTLWADIKAYFSAGETDTVALSEKLKADLQVVWLDLKELITPIAKAIWEGIRESFSEGSDSSISVMDEFREGLAQVWAGVKTLAYESGQAIAQGLIDGMKSVWSNTVQNDVMTGFFQSVMEQWDSFTLNNAKAINQWAESMGSGLDSATGHLEEFDGELDKRITHSTWIDAFENLSSKSKLHFGEFLANVQESLNSASTVMGKFNAELAMFALTNEQAGINIALTGKNASSSTAGITEYTSAIEVANVSVGQAVDHLQAWCDVQGTSYSAVGREIAQLETYMETNQLTAEEVSLCRDKLNEWSQQLASNDSQTTQSTDYNASFGDSFGEIGDSATEAIPKVEAFYTGVLNSASRFAGSVTENVSDFQDIYDAAVTRFGSYENLLDEFYKYILRMNRLMRTGVEVEVLSMSDWLTEIIGITVEAETELTETTTETLVKYYDTANTAMAGFAGKTGGSLTTLATAAKTTATQVSSAAASISSAAKSAIASINSLASAKATSGYAAGGITDHPIVMVGERGPELAALPVGTRVLSHEDMMVAASQGVQGFANGGVLGTNPWTAKYGPHRSWPKAVQAEYIAACQSFITQDIQDWVNLIDTNPQRDYDLRKLMVSPEEFIAKNPTKKYYSAYLGATVPGDVGTYTGQGWESHVSASSEWAHWYHAQLLLGYRKYLNGKKPVKDTPGANTGTSSSQWSPSIGNDLIDSGISKYLGYASGGVTGSQVVMVGERGPELAALPVGSRVMSHEAMMASLAGYADGGVVGSRAVQALANGGLVDYAGGKSSGGNTTTLNINSPLVQVDRVNASNQADVDTLIKKVSDVFMKQLSGLGLSLNAVGRA